MTKKHRALEVIQRLKDEYPDAGCTLDYDQAGKLPVRKFLLPVLFWLWNVKCCQLAFTDQA